METEAKGASGELRQVLRSFPADRFECAVGFHGTAVFSRVGVDHLAVSVEDLHAEFAVDVDKEMFSRELERARRERAARFPGVHRSESVPTQECEARGVPPGMASARVEVKPISNNQASAANGLDVPEVPRLGILGQREERLSVWTAPVPTIAAEAKANRVELLPTLFLPFPDRGVWVLGCLAMAERCVASPDCKQPQGEALVGHAVEVIELRRRPYLGPGEIQCVRSRPQDWICGLSLSSPVRALAKVVDFPIPARPRIAPSVSCAHNPAIAERVVEEGAAVAPLARVAHVRPIDAVGRGIDDPMAASSTFHLGAHHFEPLGGILGFKIQPDALRVRVAF